MTDCRHLTIVGAGLMACSIKSLITPDDCVGCDWREGVGLRPHSPCRGCGKHRVKNNNRHGLPVQTCAVVVPCHNYGRYLAECLDSVLAQNRRPQEIVVVDDRSTDETAAVAADYAQHGVRYLKVDHGSEFFSRRDGFCLTTSDAVCFVDADDRLPPNYIRQGLRILASDWRVGLVSSDVVQFGTMKGRRGFNASDLQRQNGCHAGSVVRSSAIRQTGMFDAPPPSEAAHCDWWQWRRLVDAGWQIGRSCSHYEYRKTGHSMSDRKRTLPFYDRAGHSAARVSILIPLAGRVKAWRELSTWLDNQTWPAEQISLRLLDNSHDDAFGRLVRCWAAQSRLPDVRYQQSPVGRGRLADSHREANWREVQRVVCRLWTTLTRKIDTPWALTLEDDVIPPPDLIERLLRCIDTPEVDAVIAPYLARGGGRYVVKVGRRYAAAGEFSGVTKVDSAGFGCMLVRSRQLEEHVFVHGREGERHWYDHWFADSQRLNMLCNWDCEAEHLAVPAGSPDRLLRDGS